MLRGHPGIDGRQGGRGLNGKDGIVRYKDFTIIAIKILNNDIPIEYTDAIIMNTNQYNNFEVELTYNEKYTLRIISNNTIYLDQISITIDIPNESFITMVYPNYSSDRCTYKGVIPSHVIKESELCINKDGFAIILPIKKLPRKSRIDISMYS